MFGVLRKAVAALLIIVLAASLGACSFEPYDWQKDSEEKQLIESDSALGFVKLEHEDAVAPSYEATKSLWSYNALENEQEKLLYSKLSESMYNISPAAVSNGSIFKTERVVLDGVVLNEAQIRTVIKALSYDNPLAFWISATFGHRSNSEKDYTSVQLYSDYSETSIKKRLEEIDLAVEEFLSSVPAGLSDYELEVLVHDYIIDTCEYDTATATSDDPFENSDPYEIYGALVNHKAVCEGYAKTFQYLLGLLGVDCVGVMGIGKEEFHMWNAARIDSDWYYVDVTWDDQQESFSRHNYLNINADQLAVDHEPSPLYTQLSYKEICGKDSVDSSLMNIFIPECSSTEYNYFIRECPHLTSYSDDALTSALYEAALSKEPYFTFYVDPDYLDINEAVSLLFISRPQYFFDYVNAVNGKLDDYMIDNNSIGYYTKENLSSVVVQLSYV